MSVIPFPFPEAAAIMAEWGTPDAMIAEAHQYARDLLCTCSDGDDPMALARRALDDYQGTLPAIYRAALLSEVKRLVDQY